MSAPPRAVLADAGPLMALGKLHHLELLAKVYQQVSMPQAVYHEVVEQGLARGLDHARAVKRYWVQQGWPVETVPAAALESYRPSVVLGEGERHVLALAQSLTQPLVLLDDEAARAEARRLAVPVKGTLGVLVEAHRRNHLSFQELELLFEEIAARPDLWISGRLCEAILSKLGGSRSS